jgi:hypothetical protein
MALSNKRRLHDTSVFRINTGVTPKGRSVVQVMLKGTKAALPPAMVVNDKKWMIMTDEIDAAAAAIRKHFNPPRVHASDYRCLEAIADLDLGLELSALGKLGIEDPWADEIDALLP